MFQENHRYRPSTPQKFPRDTDSMTIGNSTSDKFSLEMNIKANSDKPPQQIDNLK